MVGYEVEHLSETAVAKRRDHATERRLVPELRVELAVVDDIVSVSAARPRFQIGRGVDVANPELRQIGCERGGVPETKPPVELQAVGRLGDWRLWDWRLWIGPSGIGVASVSGIVVRFGRNSRTALGPEDFSDIDET